MTISNIIEHIKAGKPFILVDNEDRENEGDLVIAAEYATAEMINFMITHARGLVCLSLAPEIVDKLALPMMATTNESRFRTPFTVSIEAKHGIKTGISAQDRAHTIKVAIDPKSTREDVVVPGHVFPLRSAPGGILEREGHTEGSVDLMRLAGLIPAAVICEILAEDGSTAKGEALQIMSEQYHFPIVKIEDVLRFRRGIV